MGRFRTDRVPLGKLLILQVMPLRDLLYNLISNIAPFPFPILRIAGIDDIESAQNFTDVAILKSSFIQQV